MSTKNTLAILIILVAGLFFYSFVYAFKVEAVDALSVELDNIKVAQQKAVEQLTLSDLKLIKNNLTTQNTQIIENYIPQNLHSGVFVYNTAQLASQSGLVLKSIQYIVIDDTVTNRNGEKRLQVEFSMDGRYENFNNWLRTIERGNILIDVESIRAVKTTNVGENIAFTVKLYVYGLNID